MNIIEISNIPVHCFNDMEEAVSYILMNGNGKVAVAINPEKVLSALKSPEIKETILAADIRYLDGIGAVKVAEHKLGQKLSRIPGCELWLKLMERAAKENKKIYLLGANETVINNTKHKLQDEYNANIVGFHNGFFDDDDVIISDILAKKPDVLTVAMGSPRQEIFMMKCRKAGVNAFMMGVGGTYNVFTNEVKRAPAFWCNLGLEWFYRLLHEPSRIWRQIKLLKFIWLALRKEL